MSLHNEGGYYVDYNESYKTNEQLRKEKTAYDVIKDSVFSFLMDINNGAILTYKTTQEKGDYVFFIDVEFNDKEFPIDLSYNNFKSVIKEEFKTNADIVFAEVNKWFENQLGIKVENFGYSIDNGQIFSYSKECNIWRRKSEIYIKRKV